MTAAIEPGHFPNRFYGDQQGELHLNGTFLYEDGAQTGITAHAGGGQTNAVLLTSTLAQVSTVASAGDSVKLLPSYSGMSYTVSNDGANSLNIFPNTGDQINGAGANAAYALAAGHSAVITCFVAGSWKAISGV